MTVLSDLHATTKVAHGAHARRLIDETGVALYDVIIGEHYAAEALPEKVATGLAAMWNASVWALRESGELHPCLHPVGTGCPWPGVVRVYDRTGDNLRACPLHAVDALNHLHGARLAVPVAALSTEGVRG